MSMIEHLRDLEALWEHDADQSDDPYHKAFCLRMAQAQRDAIEARLAGPEAVEALLERRVREMNEARPCSICRRSHGPEIRHESE